ncbi:hypothetical protein V2G26_006374 [Clonostachys chloroleuca]
MEEGSVSRSDTAAWRTAPGQTPAMQMRPPGPPRRIKKADEPVRSISGRSRTQFQADALENEVQGDEILNTLAV